MVKFKTYLNIRYIYLLILNIGLFNCLTTINYPSTKQKQYDRGKTEYFQINFKTKITLNFLRIYVQSRGNNINQEVIMSTTIKEPNRANATLFAEQPYGDVIMYVPKDLIESEIYLNCTCYSRDCPILVRLSETNDLNLTRDCQHSFLSNPVSFEHKYYVPRANLRDKELYDQNATMTLFVIGPPDSTEIHMNYLYPKEDKKENYTIPIEYTKFDHGYITSFKEENFEYNEQGLYEIYIKSTQTNYISVGSRSILEDSYDQVNHIFPNKRGIFGYFNNSMLSGECFRINIPYINNIEVDKDEYTIYANYLVFSETAEVYFVNQKTGLIEKSNPIEGELGVIVTMDDIENNAICIRPSGGKQSILYYLELNDFNIGSISSIYSPQISGHIYTRYLPINTHLFFTHKEITLNGDEVNYNVKTLQGITRSYYIYCESYPSCHFNNYTELDNEIKNGNQNIALLKGTHNMVTHSSYVKEEESVISSKQHLLLVFCLNSTMCRFETSFCSEQTVMHLKPDDAYFQHLSTHDSNIFRLHFYKKYQIIEKLIFSLTTFNGDLNIELLSGHENYEKQYHYAGNKQIIIFEPTNEKADDIDIKIVCNYNSFFSLEYSMLSTEREDIKFIDEGASIIQTIYGRIGQTKIFQMKNNRKEEFSNYLVTFYSLNCKVRIKRDKEIIKLDNNFSQDLITPKLAYYTKDIYEYNLEVIDMDSTIKEDPMCFVQISNFEMNTNNIILDYNEVRSITIPAEYDVQINLEKSITEIKLLYPHASPKENVYFDFILEQELEIKIIFSIESYQLDQYIISRRQLIPITNNQIKNICQNNDLCPIMISISADIPDNIDKINIRVNAKTAYNDPTFIKRGELKKDTLIEDQITYYYTEINKNEVGYITVNFNRASGEVFAKILNIEETEKKVDDNNDPRYWLGKFNLPKKKSNNDLTYNPFTKNIYYDNEQTTHCYKACFALLVIKATINTDENISLPKSYDISIAVHEDEESTLIERSIDIPVNEYIIGSISSDNQLINYFQYYTFDVLTDSDIIYIDINSDSCNLYVKIGEEKPTIKTADFIFMSRGEESVYEININDSKFKDKDIKSLKGQRFTFAIGTTYADTLYTTLYAFRLRTPKKDKVDLINMNTDQLGLCSIKKNSYCYFLINVKGEEKNVNEILMHAFSADKTELKLFANILSNDIINSGNNELIKQNLPNEEKADYKSTDNYIKDYLRFNVEKGNQNQTQTFILVGILANNDTVVNFISTFYKYINNFKANSFTKQIFLLLKNQKVILEFPENLNLIVRIISIYGDGELLYENEDDLNDKQRLHGSYDEISFMHKNKNIIVRSCNEEEFGFYLIYNLRPEENYDDILYGSSILFNLEKENNEKIDFPLIYYSKLNNNNQAVDFNIKILDFEYQNDKRNDNIRRDTNDFQILGVITKKSIVLGKKMNQYVNPDMSDAKYGSYDQALHIGKVHFTSGDIEKYSVKQEKEDETNEDKYLYVTISKSPTNNNIYKKIACDISILPSNNIKYKAHIRQYNYGNILHDFTYNKYNLVSDNENAKIMKIEFAKNNVNIDFTITTTDSIDYKKNMTFIKSETKYGRNIILLKLPESYNVYLNVFLKDKSKIDLEKLNIVFRYDVFETQEESENEGCILKSEDITSTFNDKKLNLKIKPMQRNDKNINALYSIRIIPQDNAHEEEILDSISIYSFENEYIFHKEFSSDIDIINIDINDFPSKEEYYYVTVFATDLNTKQFLAYNLIKIGERNPIDYTTTKKYRVMMSILFCAIGILVLVLIIVIIRMKKQNAKLEDEVEVLKINFDEESEKNKNKKISLLGEDD